MTDRSAASRLHVLHAVIEDGLTIVAREWWPGLDAVAHRFLLLRRHMRQAVMDHGAEQAISGDRRATVGEGAELGEEIQDARRHRPAEGEEAADLGGGVVGDEQGVGPRVEGADLQLRPP